ncbi:MFS transporter [Bradyrhizobium stylosanthis]|uniref:AAHS family 4-hydroxybenzoate transporter-like MFS transporter n=1 Tax=Bradyrhizobium stylosanthis TaxID=1803665 RepID=A0A560DZA1_9BRAD|nr:MFS transporter [Bradyrhizobium stylosanthis]TWB02438.1 AAHS family 4-hydroxybenzoate transporter-like MFS transporter [Bradyrhizobium stylosanthis]
MSNPAARGDLGELLDQQRITAYQLFVVALCFLVMVIDGYDLFMVAMALPKIAASFGVKPAALTPVLALQNLGLALGTAMIGIISDRYGRKKTLSFSIGAFAACTLVSTVTHDIVSFAATRLVTSFFLAGVIPNAIALTNEMSSLRFRQGFVSLVFSGYAVGAALASLAVGSVLRDFSWQAIFVTAAAAGFLILIVVLALLPESIRFLATRERGHAQAMRQLRRIIPDRDIDAAILLQAGEASPKTGRSPVRALFEGSRGNLTLLMWTVFALSFVSLSSFAALGPVILNLTADLPLQTAGSLMVTFSLGGLVGTAVSGFVLDRLGPKAGLTLWYAGSTACWLLFAFNVNGEASGHIAILLAGAAMTGAQGALNSFVATVYPTKIRATGVGWAFGVGRLAGIASPLIFSPFVAAPGLQIQYFALLALPTFLVVFCVPFLTSADRAAHDEAEFEREQPRSI